jgi:hypothetical protein
VSTGDVWIGECTNRNGPLKGAVNRIVMIFKFFIISAKVRGCKSDLWE